ncbi:MAG: hypothetical protein WCO56_21960 [Verrucomicrobiota bacterium]
MPFDPSKPADESLASAAELRDQFNAVVAMVAALNARLDALEASGCVTQQQLSDAINGVLNNSSASTNSVGMLEITASDPPSQWEVGTVINTLNATLQAMRRV